MIHRRRRSNFADRLLEYPELVLSDGAECSRRGAWRKSFRDRIGDRFDGRIFLEIGCNDAMLLCRIAAGHPPTAFIGIDWKCRALHTAAMHVTEAGLRNISLLHGRAQDLCSMFCDRELDEIWIFHPDPCDKPQELKNRLVSQPFLIDVHRMLRKEGTLALKTDHREYYESVLNLLEDPAVSARFTPTASSSDFWNDTAARTSSGQRCFSGEATRFEERFRRRRQPIHYLELRKRAHGASRPLASNSGVVEPAHGRVEVNNWVGDRAGAS